MSPLPIRDVLPTTIELGEKFVKFFQSLKKEFWGDQEEAFKKLRDVIDEMLKFYKATNEEISNFMSLDFSNKNSYQPNRKALYNITGGSIKVRIVDAKGHCSRIKRIYDNYLDKWLRKKLDNEKYNEINNLFLSLSIYDDDMVEAATNLEAELIEKSNKLLEFLNNKNFRGVVASQEGNIERFQPVQQRLSSVMEQMVILRNEFMSIANAD